jgi:DNA-binding NtrC family response regulator
MPMGLQVKLLRVLQEREITPIGATQTIRINTRVLAATNRNLEDEVKAGRFREDLYFRLTILKINVPSLKAREDDIPMLVEYFIRRFNERFGKAVRPPSHELLARLKAHHWPGNIRELQNAVERGVVLSEHDQLSIEQMFGLKYENDRKRKTEQTNAGHKQLMTLTEAKENFEKAYLKEVLAAANGNISDAARLCGRYRTDIYRLTEKYGLSLDEFRH